MEFLSSEKDYEETTLTTSQKFPKIDSFSPRLDNFSPK